MSCNGCRVLRKRCGEDCILRSSLNWIQSPESQANATIFVAKFFGRADLMSFISAVSDHQRSALFESLLFEACGRTVNPVSGAIGLLCSGNWKLCQDAVEVVLAGGVLRPLHPEFLTRMLSSPLSDADRSKSAAIESGMADFQLSNLWLSPVKLETRRETTPFESDVSEGSFEDCENGAGRKPKLLNLFV